MLEGDLLPIFTMVTGKLKDMPTYGLPTCECSLYQYLGYYVEQ